MSKINTVAYHTCSSDNGMEYILEHSPFQCKERRGQWLGIGHYFWPDADYFAHEWGKIGYRNSYAIVKFSIIYQYDELFDLTGNMAHKLEFKSYCDELKKMLEARIAERPEDLQIKEIYNDGEISVSEVFWYLRKFCRDRFSYKLVKAADKKPVDKPMKFVANKTEEMDLIERIQMVVYPEAISYATCDGIHYPKTPHEGDKNEKL